MEIANTETWHEPVRDMLNSLCVYVDLAWRQVHTCGFSCATYITVRRAFIAKSQCTALKIYPLNKITWHTSVRIQTVWSSWLFRAWSSRSVDVAAMSYYTEVCALLLGTCREEVSWKARVLEAGRPARTLNLAFIWGHPAANSEGVFDCSQLSDPCLHQ